MSFGPRPFEPLREKKQLRRLLLATGASFFILLALVLLVGAGYHFIIIKSEDFIEAFQRKIGMPIRVGSKTVGIKAIDFGHVLIGANPSTMIQQISVSTDLTEGQVDHLAVAGADVNFSVDQLQQLMRAVVPKQGIATGFRFPNNARRLWPSSMHVEIPHFRLWHNGQVILYAKQVVVRYAENQAKGEVAFAGIQIYGRDFLPASRATLAGTFRDGKLQINLQNLPHGSTSPYTLSVQLNKSEQQASIQLRAKGLNWSVIPGVADHIVNYQELPVAINANLRLNQRDQILISWSGATGKASILHEKIATKAISPLVFRTQGQLGLDLGKRQLTVYRAQMGAGGSSQEQVNFHLGMKAKHLGEGAGWSVAGFVKLPPTPCQELLAAVPENAGDVFEDFTAIAGQVGGTARFKFNTSTPSDFIFSLSDGVMDCKLRSEDPQYSRAKLNSDKAVVSNFQLASGYISEYPYDNFIGLRQIPVHIRDAFLVSEDGGFYLHNGFSLATFESAFRRNLKEGRAALGASTITMQTAKNLWLSGEKTVWRKLQEALLTVYLEDVVSKDRIFEMYLNMVEFGPGIYGIKNAAEHFFAKGVSELNILEAAYLASLLPSPVRRYTYFCNGFVSPAYRKLIDQKISWMFQFKKIESSAYEAAKRTQLVFDRSNREDSQYCPSPGLRYSNSVTN